MTDTALAPGKSQLSLLQPLSLLFGVISAVLAIYFWLQTARFGESLAGPWYALSALTFSVLAAVAMLSWGLSVKVRTRSPGTSETAAVVGLICGLLPPTLTLTFALLEVLG